MEARPQLGEDAGFPYISTGHLPTPEQVSALLGIMQGTTATPEQVAEAVRVNTESRLLALKMTLLIMAGVSLLAIAPASRLPSYKPGEIPDNPPPLKPEELRRAAQEADA
jgi:hypothetical protein